MIRAAVVGVFMVIATLIVSLAMYLGTETPTGAILVNLGTELFGIVITVAVVEWFFERRRLQDRARDLAWGVLHEIEHGVWMWQGGPRRLSTDQLLGLVSSVTADDTLTPYTQALFQAVGDRASQVMQRELAAVKSIGGLKDALSDITSLKSLGEGSNAEPRRTEIRMISEILESSMGRLARVLGQPDQHIPAALIRYRDPSLEGQNRRQAEARTLIAGDGHNSALGRSAR